MRVLLAVSVAFVCLAASVSASEESDLPEWLGGPDWAHRASQLHESEPLSERAEFVRPLLMAHFKEVDYIICGDVLGPLFDSRKNAHQVVAWQIIFASGDWVEQHSEQAEDIDAYTLAGLESGLRAYKAILKSKPKARNKLLDDLLERHKNDQLSSWVDENPCQPE